MPKAPTDKTCRLERVMNVEENRDSARSQPCGLEPSARSSGLDVERAAAIVAKAICKSGRFETGEGTCAVLCMEALGNARAGQGCRHTSRIHGRMAADIVAALAALGALGPPESLRRALAVFAAIKPSGLYPADGSEAEPYVIMLHDPKMLGQGGAPDFTGADLASARAALAKAEGRS